MGVFWRVKKLETLPLLVVQGQTKKEKSDKSSVVFD